ncbi:hypothetical protein KAF25_003773 [Fusarium avenaceum]|uniref:Uncharacterized protein n=1 Tax=Fusarium avenaceum TaxID=40199 RepID=A0A9P7KNX9_9HYPO|nr:hypothetical protein KAF25_003773 [Fusarium avenaceum]
MTDKHPSNDSNHVSQATKSEPEIPPHQRKLNFDHRLVTITISELNTIKSLIESPDALSVADLRVWLGKRDETHNPSDHPPGWQLGQCKHLLPCKQDEQRSAPETLPVPDQPDESPLPPIAAVCHDIPNTKCPSMNIAKEILGQRQASTYYARHIECSSIIMDALTVPLMPLLPHVETPEMAALFERLDIAQWKLSMLVLNVGHYCGISVSKGTSADR